MAKILVIDDEMGIRELLSEILEDEGHEVLIAENATRGHAIHINEKVDLILLDIWMPDEDGVSLLRKWVELNQLSCPVIMMSGHASIDTAVEATGLGAVDFLEKPITMHRLLAAVHKALVRGIKQITKPTNNTSNQTPDNIPSPSNPAVLAQASATNTLASNNSEDPRSLSTPDKLFTSIWHKKLAELDLNLPLREVRDQLEKIYFLHLLERENWAMTRVAELCGLERTHLYRKLKSLNIEITRNSKQSN